MNILKDSQLETELMKAISAQNPDAGRAIQELMDKADQVGRTARENATDVPSTRTIANLARAWAANIAAKPDMDLDTLRLIPQLLLAIVAYEKVLIAQKVLKLRERRDARTDDKYWRTQGSRNRPTDAEQRARIMEVYGRSPESSETLAS